MVYTIAPSICQRVITVIRLENTGIISNQTIKNRQNLSSHGRFGPNLTADPPFNDLSLGSILCSQDSRQTQMVLETKSWS